MKLPWHPTEIGLRKKKIEPDKCKLSIYIVLRMKISVTVCTPKTTRVYHTFLSMILAEPWACECKSRLGRMHGVVSFPNQYLCHELVAVSIGPYPKFVLYASACVFLKCGDFVVTVTPVIGRRVMFCVSACIGIWCSSSVYPWPLLLLKCTTQTRAWFSVLRFSFPFFWKKKKWKMKRENWWDPFLARLLLRL